MNHSGKADVAYPLECEWCISPSASDIEVRAAEDGDCIVSTLVVVPPKDSTVAEHSGRLVTKRTRLRFEAAGWVRLCPSYSDRETIEPGRFDFSNVPFHDAFLTAEQTNFSTTFNLHDHEYKAWVATGICPNPGVYEIKNSTWLAQSGAIRCGCKDYGIEGREMLVEILAQQLHLEPLWIGIK